MIHPARATRAQVLNSPAGLLSRVVLAVLCLALSFGACAQSTDQESAPGTPSAPAPAAPTTAAQPGAETEQNEPMPPPPSDPIPVDEIRVLVEVFHKIKQDYVEAIDDQTLLENAMRGMLAGLDPHSAYLDADDYLDLQEGTTGEFGGLGIEVGVEDGFVKVVAPIDDTPAQKAGIQAGDTIIRLDDTPVKGMSINDAVKKMRGKPGTDISLTIVREGEQEPLEFKLTRALVKVASVRARMLEPGYGYVRISQFQAATGDDLLRKLSELKGDDQEPLRGLILDLRNNPGGILGAAVAVADAFMETGRVVYTEGRVQDAKLEFSAKPPDLLRGAPLIVLINEGSASASEIVAGALQDSARALIMGRRSFGKGSVQTILPMNNKAALKLTTARYFTPSGRSIQAEGIKPDIVIDKVRVAKVGGDGNEAVKEADLDRHLERPDEAKPAGTARDGAKDAADEPPLAERDYELYEALNMLKGMALLSTRRESK